MLHKVVLQDVMLCTKIAYPKATQNPYRKNSHFDGLTPATRRYHVRAGLAWRLSA
jgi:hypothetical protein